MVPMSIDEVEATMNFSQALGFLSADIENGTYTVLGSYLGFTTFKKSF